MACIHETSFRYNPLEVYLSRYLDLAITELTWPDPTQSKVGFGLGSGQDFETPVELDQVQVWSLGTQIDPASHLSQNVSVFNRVANGFQFSDFKKNQVSIPVTQPYPAP